MVSIGNIFFKYRKLDLYSFLRRVYLFLPGLFFQTEAFGDFYYYGLLSLACWLPVQARLSGALPSD
jgi:hypothetical protein